MKRRDFLKFSSLILPAAAAMGVVNPFTNKIFAAVKGSGSFSLSVITDHPSKTIHTIEQAIKNSQYSSNTLQFTEYSLNGRFVGDIAYVKSQKLIDYHKSSDDFSRLLDESAGILSLPKVVDNPMLLRFSSGEISAEPAGINIFRGNSLVKHLSLEKEVDDLRIEGLKGHVNIGIKNKKVKIISATCKHKTCMNMEAISRPGENLICIPNQINIVIAGKSKLGVDSITF